MRQASTIDPKTEMGTLSVAQQQIVEIAKAISTNDIWDEYCKRMGVATENEWLDVVQQYEKDVQFKREDEKVGS